jgi:hypothetical protein
MITYRHDKKRHIQNRVRMQAFDEREGATLSTGAQSVVAKCIASGLVGGEAFSVDASLIKADVDKKKRMPGDQSHGWI